MAKMALLIGVSEYEPGLMPLLGAAKDVEAMRRVLQNSEVGDFDDVKTLSNPDPLVMQEAIETLFSGRTKGDLVLLFFSGHGVKDDNGKLHLATRITRKSTQGGLIRATSVPASFVQDIMSNSRSRRQVVILDCCFSGAFAEGWLAKDDGSVDVKKQLGGEGRAVLTSSTSTQYSFEQEGSDLSTYTRYLVEGIETGAADLDSDGVVSIDELHEYAKGKVQETAPAMKPEIYAVKEGYKIHLSQAPTEDPKLRYRKEVEHCVSRGVISTVGRYTLDALRDGLGLLLEDATAIEDEVLKPYQEYRKKLQRYKQALVEAIEREHSLSDNTQNELKRLQRVLKLRDEDIAQIEAQVISQNNAIQPSGTPADVIQSQSHFLSTEIAPVSPSNETVVASQAKTSKSFRVGLPRVSAIPVPVLRKPKLLIGAGITTAVALTLIFMGKTPQPPQVEPLSTASPTVSSDPQTSAQNFNRGLAKYNLGDNRGAIADYDRAIKLKPYYSLAYNSRGLAKSNLGDNQGAIADYDRAIQINQNWGAFDSNYFGLSSAYYNRGNAKLNLGDNQGAIADYDRAIQLEPNADAYYSRGLAKYNLGDKQGAIADYNQALKLNPNNASVYFYRGLARRDKQGSISDYNQALKLNPNNEVYYFARGNAKSNLGDTQGAIADYDQAIKLKPDYAGAYFYRGKAKSNLGDNQGAIADYQKAAELYRKQGKTKDYQDALEQVKKLQ